MTNYHPSRFCTAPMIDWTDRHCRMLFRLFSEKMQIFTEMVTTGAILHGNKHQFLDFSPKENPLVLQLGGSTPEALSECVKIAKAWGYSEVNLNLGCPSPRVQKGAFGACLMAETQLVADCVKAMQEASDLPISIKCRLGIDDLDSEDFLFDFLGAMADIQCRNWIIHARKAVLNGLSPKENRTVPPLNYARVYKAKNIFPQARIILNGGLTEQFQIKEALTQVDGVMVGRAAYQSPQSLMVVDQDYFDQQPHMKTTFSIAHQYSEYMQRLPNHEQKKAIRHALGLFRGLKGAKQWRRTLSEGLTHAECPYTLWREALDKLESSQEYRPEL